MKRFCRLAPVVALICTASVMDGAVADSAPHAAPDAATIEAGIDRIFSTSTATTPGCAVGASVDGKPVLDKAYGTADLEHEVPNTTATVFEAGSVSKQFTAAAVLLLARDGKVSLDDPVSKYVPELPDYGVPLTIRHLLTHTSGLRDWGSIEAIAGWPRSTRVYTHAHVLEILGRQRSLNFPPGTHWSYSNSGFNLAAIIVTRASGMPFVEFTRQRIFEPLGMTHTSWRDDYQRIVKHRAMAYAPGGGSYITVMPFENVFGDSSLLTTAGDLLKWNENFTSSKVGDAAFVRAQEQPGKFNDGQPHHYGMGLWTGTYKGFREVSHAGATAGYAAMLLRFPDQKVSVAVLCNLAMGVSGADRKAYAVADLLPGAANQAHCAGGCDQIEWGRYRCHRRNVSQRGYRHAHSYRRRRRRDPTGQRPSAGTEFAQAVHCGPDDVRSARTGQASGHADDGCPRVLRTASFPPRPAPRTWMPWLGLM